jgi:hypothetical protein
MVGDFTGIRETLDARRIFPGFTRGEGSAKVAPWQFEPISKQEGGHLDGAEMSEDLQDEGGIEGLEESGSSEKKEGGFFSNLIDNIKSAVKESGIISKSASLATDGVAGRLAGEGAEELEMAAGKVIQEGADDVAKAAGQEAGLVASQGLGQTAGNVLGKAVPVIGPAVSLGIDKATTGEVTDRDLVRVGGGTAGGMLGGALAGAAIGSVVPGIGTAAGFAVGLGASLLGGYLGGKAAEKAYDVTGAKEKKVF